MSGFTFEQAWRGDHDLFAGRCQWADCYDRGGSVPVRTGGEQQWRCAAHTPGRSGFRASLHEADRVVAARLSTPDAKPEGRRRPNERSEAGGH